MLQFKGTNHETEFEKQNYVLLTRHIWKIRIQKVENNRIEKLHYANTCESWYRYISIKQSGF